MSRPDPWQSLATLTAARIALGRAGNSLPTAAVLSFDVAHALARDAVHQALDVDGLAARWREMGGAEPLVVHSRAVDRHTYLQRPDLGRCLDEASAATLLAQRVAEAPDVAIVIADGLSATAVHENALPLLHALLPQLDGLRITPPVIARQSRVALGDEVGAVLGARLVLVILGERPGLSSPDSLGAYLTFAPKIGRLDAERNCVSNIRPAGLTPAAASVKLAWLIRSALARQLTGIGLKDDSETLALPREKALAPPLKAER
jgi:ethanolamine ammonia-lyase small subunit